jgi:hypothetical protein
MWRIALQEHQLWGYNPLPFPGKPFFIQKLIHPVKVVSVADHDRDRKKCPTAEYDTVSLSTFLARFGSLIGTIINCRLLLFDIWW